MTKHIYLAAPIDRADEQTTHIVQQVTGFLYHVMANRDLVMYRPGMAYRVGYGTTPDQRIRQVNNTALDGSDGMLVIWPKFARSWGVPAEIERAILRDIPVALVTDAPLTYSQQYPYDQVSIFQTNGTLGAARDGSNWNGAAVKALDWLQQVHSLPVVVAEDSEPVGEVPPGYLRDTRSPSQARDVRPAPSESSRPQEGDGRQTRDLPFTSIVPDTDWTLPTRAYSDDAGLDLYVMGQHRIEPGQFKDIPCGLAVELPEGTWGFLVGRSSTLRKKRLLVNPGIIDRGYRGELFAGVQNLADHVVQVGHGERLAQLIVMANVTETMRPVAVSTLNTHPRGLNGFGSSGV